MAKTAPRSRPPAADPSTSIELRNTCTVTTRTLHLPLCVGDASMALLAAFITVCLEQGRKIDREDLPPLLRPPEESCPSPVSDAPCVLQSMHYEGDVIRARLHVEPGDEQAIVAHLLGSADAQEGRARP